MKGIYEPQTITVVTPFKRIENLSALVQTFKDKCHWIVLQADDEPLIDFPEWVDVRRYPIVNKQNISNRLFNQFISNGVNDQTQYILLNDDDSVEEGFFEKIPDVPVAVVGMKRGNKPVHHVVWDNWKEKIFYYSLGVDILEAKPEEMKVARVGGEQLIVKGYVLKNHRYGLADSSADVPGDAQFILKVLEEHEPIFVPNAYVLFNYFEPGRFK